jgi:hypothetical protein
MGVINQRANHRTLQPDVQADWSVESASLWVVLTVKSDSQSNVSSVNSYTVFTSDVYLLVYSYPWDSQILNHAGII